MRVYIYIKVFRMNKEGRHQAQMVWHQSVWNPVLTSWPPSSHRSSTDHWSCAESLHASNSPPVSPSQRNPKLLDLMTQTCGSNVCGHEIIWKTGFGLSEGLHSTGPLLDPLQFVYRGNRSVDDSVIMGLHLILQHLDRPGTYVRILFVASGLWLQTPHIQHTPSSNCYRLVDATELWAPERPDKARQGKFICIAHFIHSGNIQVVKVLYIKESEIIIHSNKNKELKIIK